MAYHQLPFHVLLAIVGLATICFCLTAGVVAAEPMDDDIAAYLRFRDQVVSIEGRSREDRADAHALAEARASLIDLIDDHLNSGPMLASTGNSAIGISSAFDITFAASTAAEEEADKLDEALENAPADKGGDSTGTDPRGFSHKLMPYYLYTELNNDIKVQQLNFFAMFAFSPDFAMTIDIPVVKHVDYSDFGLFKKGTGGLPPGNGQPGLPGGGVPFKDLDGDGDTTGNGDLNLRLFVKVGWDGSIDEENTWMIMPLIETTLPTASDDVLGGDATIVSPGFTVVIDIPGEPPFGLGFIAMMNFYDFDVDKDNSRTKTRRFRGRWFWMQPLTPPEMGALGGLYVLTEFQPIYDFESDDFDLFIAPEFGKIMKPGWIIYGKPGFGVNPDPEDRKFTFEIGTRIFF